uniref:Histone-lysine N-methyltransferase SUVR5 n=1 Tax=Anthurium amnicola TaxID=1678845 RepID=A0A1D1XSB7_9ARAE
MEVLSCPEIQYAGESNCPQQSPGSKLSDHGLEEKPTLMQVHCHRERAGNELMIGIRERNQSVLEMNYNLRLPENNQSNGRKITCDDIQEFSIVKSPRVERLNDSHIAENTLWSVRCPQELQGSRMLNDHEEENATFHGTDTLQTEECNVLSDSCQECTPLKGVRQEGKLELLSGKEGQDMLASPECHGEQVLEGLNKVNGYVPDAEDTQRDETNEGKQRSDVLVALEPMFSGPDFQCDEWSRKLHDSSNHAANRCDYASVNLSFWNQIVQQSASFNDSHSMMKKVEAGILQNINQEGEPVAAESTEQDGPEALWVKWRGKWQTGIRCSRADYPLSTLKAKPTHERKKYFVVFFPNTRTYSWVDMQLVRSIDELPEPLAYGSHYSWLAFVKDLAFPRRYIMQKLAVSMLDLSDQLHTEAVIESARKASSWKEFAMEASLCSDYFELGMMLLKLHKMILPEYINFDWLQHSFDLWMQQCKKAETAETIELLTEELVDSVLWNNVEELWEAPVQPELGTEWRTWKQEVMKLFSTSHPGGSGVIDKRSLNTGPHFSRKRPKLEIRRPDICVNEAGAKTLTVHFQDIMKYDPGKSNCQGLENCMDTCKSSNVDISGTGITTVSRNLASNDDIAVESVNLSNIQTSAVGTSVDIGGQIELPNDHRDKDLPKKYRQCLAFIGAKGRQCGRWANDGEMYCCVHLGNRSVNNLSQAEQTTPFKASMSAGTSVVGSGGIALADCHRDKDFSNKDRQCLAFIQAKGRQCGRWANGGDIYCCAHLSNHYVNKHSQPELTPPLEVFMCEGTTTHGQKCKHRARPGTAFCKKHKHHGTNDLMVPGSLLTSAGNHGKGKHGMEMLPETTYTSSATHNNLLLTEAATLMDDNLIPVAVGETLDERNLLRNKLEFNDALSTLVQVSTSDSPRCIGFGYHNNDEQCLQNAKRHTLYCEKHLPNFLKRARNGKNRFISREIFVNLLKRCKSRQQKIHLHRACELLYGFMKNSLSNQKSISQGDHMGCILSEASKDLNIGEYLMKLVSSEREKIGRIWGFDKVQDKQVQSLEMNPVPAAEAVARNHCSENIIKCKICTEGFCDDKSLSMHWMEIHKKEAEWLFRGYACAVCMTSFTNRKVQEAHVKEKHGTQFLEGSLLFRCMSCNNHFTNASQLWQHVLSSHSLEFRLPDCSKSDNFPLKAELHNGSCLGDGASDKEDGRRRFICRFCGLKFDLLPDLDRHHQSAHMNLSYVSHFPSITNNHLKHTRLRHSRFKKGLGATFGFKKSAGFNMQKCFEASSSVVSSRVILHTQASPASCLGRLLEFDCFNVAQALFTEIQQTKSRPSNMEILSIARSTCCRTHLHEVLKEKHGTLPKNLYLKAAKLCSELSIPVSWHLDGFICPKGCNPSNYPNSSSPLTPLLNKFVEPDVSTLDHMNNCVEEMDDCHYVLNSKHLNCKPIQKTIVLCEDMSFGLESFPVACVVDEGTKVLFGINFNETSGGQDQGNSMPWLGFTYVTKRLLDPALGLDTKSSQLGCACSDTKCYPETCDHVYLFDNDYENAKDIHGYSMRGQFPYDERGRIVVEEGCLVYECNSLCSCDKTCQNRVLQNGVRVKLEVFTSEKKGWAVRAAEAIPRGTFICEYIGEVLNDVEANKRGERYDIEGCSYLYDIDAHIDVNGRLTEGKVPYVIDATKYGNVSRFINHSCSPNLVNYQVLVESMDCQLAHIGLYAGRDILPGEELAYDYRYKLLPGVGCPCYCGASDCRGRLY